MENKYFSSATYGNNGWFIFKDNASVTDQSGEGNNWTVTAGSVTPTQDNPSNIFCTLNPLATGNSKPTFPKILIELLEQQVVINFHVELSQFH